MIEGILVEGLIYGIMALGVFTTFRLLNFPDLTVDGSFPLGAAVMATCLILEWPLWIGFTLSILAGSLAGAITAIIHNELKIPSLLAGILTMTMLYSINIRVMNNKPNISLLRTPHLISDFKKITESILDSSVAQLLLILGIVVVISLILNLFFRTDLGLTIGAIGNNEQMVTSQGANPKLIKIIGVASSNALVAFSGSLVAQYQGFADVGLGIGIVVSGLAMVMIGEFLILSTKIHWLIIRVFAGATVYKGIMYSGRYYGYMINLTPTDLRLITGLLIIVSLVITKFDVRSIGKKR